MEIDPIRGERRIDDTTQQRFPSWFQKAKPLNKQLEFKNGFGHQSLIQHGTARFSHTIHYYDLFCFAQAIYLAFHFCSGFHILSLVVAVEIFTLTQKRWKSSPINKPDSIRRRIFVTIWHKRIINNSIGLIRNICRCHYLDLSAADFFPFFTPKKKHTIRSPLTRQTVRPLSAPDPFTSRWCLIKSKQSVKTNSAENFRV